LGQKTTFALPKCKIMYAIVEIAGQQFKAEAGKKLYVHRLEGNEGDKISFDKVLLTDNGSAVSVGVPTVAGVAVSATILRHLKGDKVIIFKKKRRKGYKKLNGHRQSFTQISVDSIA
jgi:large subunit ribosomal protein L21